MAGYELSPVNPLSQRSGNQPENGQPAQLYPSAGSSSQVGRRSVSPAPSDIQHMGTDESQGLIESPSAAQFNGQPKSQSYQQSKYSKGQKTRWQNSREKLRKIRDKPFQWTMLVEVVTTGVLVLAVAFGTYGQTFGFSTVTISGIASVDTDLQLALLGAINKFLDICVQASLGHTASTCITMWMLIEKSPKHVSWLTGSRGSGAALNDFELKAELTNPWKAISNSWARYKREGGLKSFGLHGWVRFFCSLAISTSLLLLGVGINTIGIPKERWYPDPLGQGYWVSKTRHQTALTIQTPQITLSNVSWSNLQSYGLSTVGGDSITNPYSANEFGWGLSAAGIFQTLDGLPGVFGIDTVDWYSVYDDGNILTGVYNNITDNTAQTVSLQMPRITTFYKETQAAGSSSARHSIGFNGNINMTVPRLRSSCVSRNSGLDMPENQINVTQAISGSTSFSILLGPSIGLQFPGANCTLTLSQVLLSINTWIINGGSPWAGITGVNPGTELPVLPSTSINAAITTSLADQFSSIMPMLNGLMPSNGFLPPSILISRMLQSRSGQSRAQDDYGGLGAVYGLLASHLLNQAILTESKDPKLQVSSYPVRWQVYGSGPRLAWEWVAVAAIAIVILAMLYGIATTMIYNKDPGTWLELTGAMVTANRSEPIKSFTGKYKTVEDLDELKKKKEWYCIKETDDHFQLVLKEEI